jgi:nicotinate dehydrogenase subunit B
METITSLSRRGILKMAAGALVVRFALGQPSGDAAKSLDPSEVDSFLAIHADGSVTIYTSKVDVGTGLPPRFARPRPKNSVFRSSVSQ